MVNLALNGVFAPGSVFKPVVALAALQEGVISAGTTLHLRRRVELFRPEPGLPVRRRHPRPVRGHRPILPHSTSATWGLNLGIARLAPYAEYFGLGTTTGRGDWRIHGHHVQPQEYRENHGVNWTDGVSAQTAHRSGGQHVHPHPAGHHVRHHRQRAACGCKPTCWTGSPTMKGKRCWSSTSRKSSSDGGRSPATWPAWCGRAMIQCATVRHRPLGVWGLPGGGGRQNRHRGNLQCPGHGPGLHRAQPELYLLRPRQRPGDCRGR